MTINIEEIEAAKRVFEVFCGGNVDWTAHSIDDSDDSIFRSADWSQALILALAALSSKNEEQALVIRELVAAIDEGAQVNTPDLMEWVAERFIFVHNESPHVDYVLSLRRRAEKLRKASEVARAAIAKAKP